MSGLFADEAKRKDFEQRLRHLMLAAQPRRSPTPAETALAQYVALVKGASQMSGYA